ncbi:GerAB/ArcD/ProY family transporter (plasmid) [Priestia megaterium NCT-2]|uniref:GerAB/ArcD/ProY family transporter n=1 Tax=Priestia megaterium TaxID=1404 RepID=UPI00034DFC0C|nr:GerAB/ArcD/ProY family transporter [Priestia megaterium]AYE53797.1 GerAB/ArcD/ProY family transporter [Priestia megaterium NCT-2]
MEKAKISGSQLFTLMMLFEFGSAFLLPVAIEAKQDAWLSIMFGMIGGGLLFLIYYQLYLYYPDLLLVEFIPKIMGKWIGRLLSFLYIFYFANLAARVIRDFGDMLLTFAYPDTPLFIVNALLMFVVIYTVSKGIEVLARSSQLLFMLIYLFAISGFILIVCSGLIDLANLKPVLEEGIGLPLKVALTQNIYFPFGEMVVFLMISPYVKNMNKGIGLSAIGLTGINLMITMLINVSVLGVSLTARSQFPLLSTVQSIQVADFLERLDVFFMLAAVIGGFIRISVFFYAVVIGTTNLFKIKSSSSLCYPLGFVILLYSLSLANNYEELVQEGIKTLPFYLDIPLQVVVPLLLLLVAFFRNRASIKKSESTLVE